MKCEKCTGPDALTHDTKDHREDWMSIQEPCEECGAKAGEECKPGCQWGDSVKKAMEE